ncbi:Ig-like domain-containing protein [Streptomyces niveiscabiei]|uniref:L,D-transpeptidase n=1 Tax=Streptomyces niveiscabiei TaxID=164115 RepID=UPI0029AF432F|nr:Ig-like domain-containing protein [Streptomyces niveiscabiei]MDX3387099.1 Ig-like domain-containing protein [Streptomyces niveiscabiei]
MAPSSTPSTPGGRALKTYGTAATAAAVLAVALTVALHPNADTPATDGKPAPPRPEVRVGTHSQEPHSPGRTAPVDPDAPVTVTLRGQGHLTDVTLKDDAGRRVAGHLDPSARVWRSTHVLRAATHYVAEVRTDPQPHDAPHRTEFTTSRARSGLLTVTLGPSGGDTRDTSGAGAAGDTRSTSEGARTYGVGQIVTAHLSHPVPPESRALLESHLKVTATPAAGPGAWHWLDPTTLHYRPRTYWPARADIRVTADDLAGLRLTDHLRVAPVVPLRFSTGPRVEAVIDASAHRMSVLRDGTTLRVIPITTGKEGYRTRAGIKVVLDKQAVLRMRSTTIGIPSDTDEAYDLPVRHAIRLTRSGEYLHAAPWAASSFGRRDVSHGCVGMSEKDAAWLFLILGEGDITRTVHTRGQEMTPFSNGVGDWNMPWRTWVNGSALNGSSTARPAEEHLRPSAS